MNAITNAQNASWKNRANYPASIIKDGEVRSEMLETYRNETRRIDAQFKAELFAESEWAWADEVNEELFKEARRIPNSHDFREVAREFERLSDLAGRLFALKR